MSAYVLLGLLTFLSLLKPLLYKKVSMTLDDDSGPIFTSVWALIGLAVVFPLYGDLLTSEWKSLNSSYFLWFLLVLKGGLFWLLLYDGLMLTRKSLSSANFILPTALGFIAIINSLLGETLSILEWGVALGLCGLGIIFSFRGHLQDLGWHKKLLFFKLVGITIILATLDFIILKDTNWYVLLLVSNLFVLIVSLSRCLPLKIWKESLFRKEAVLAGASFSVVDLLKFYLMVSILPMTVVISAQVATIPIVLMLSAVLWGERGWKEQLLWGGRICRTALASFPLGVNYIEGVFWRSLNVR